MSYEPARSKDGLNPHVLRSTGLFVLFSTLFFGVWVWLMTLLFGLSGEDPDLQIRYLAAKATAVIVGVFLVFGILQVIEMKTNGNLLGRILQDAMASAVFAGFLILCGTLIYVWGYG